MMRVKIGLDVEFMAKYKGQYAYPALKKYEDLKNFGCDEFGHCVEARPNASDKKSQFIYNVMEEMEQLPDKYKYYPINAVQLPKADFFNLLKIVGDKPISTCSNIYGKDILDDNEYEDALRKNGMRGVYCGMHIHMSTWTTQMTRLHKDKNPDGILTEVELPVNMPYRIITALLDNFAFGQLISDNDFNIGRYRSKGFYELKTDNHFEYRSLGVTAFTPQRLSIIFDIVKHVVEHYDELFLWLYADWDAEKVPINVKILKDLASALHKTKPFYSSDLKKLWVPWR